MAADVNPRLHEAIQADLHEDEVTQGSVVVGWALVVETVTPDGGRTLSRYDRGADGDRLPRWQRAGYLHDGLYGDWPDARG